MSNAGYRRSASGTDPCRQTDVGEPGVGDLAFELRPHWTVADQLEPAWRPSATRAAVAAISRSRRFTSR